MSAIELEYDFSHLRESKARHDAELARKGSEHGAVWAQKFADYDLLRKVAAAVSEGDFEDAGEVILSFHKRLGSDYHPPGMYLDAFVEAAATVFDAFEAAEG